MYLIDNKGKSIHEWNLPYRVGRYARLLPNGNLAVGMKDPDAPAPFPFARLSPMSQYSTDIQFNKYGGGVYMELTPDGKVVNEWRDPLGHHEWVMIEADLNWSSIK